MIYGACHCDGSAAVAACTQSSKQWRKLRPLSPCYTLQTNKQPRLGVFLLTRNNHAHSFSLGCDQVSICYIITYIYMVICRYHTFIYGFTIHDVDVHDCLPLHQSLTGFSGAKSLLKIGILCKSRSNIVTHYLAILANFDNFRV